MLNPFLPLWCFIIMLPFFLVGLVVAFGWFLVWISRIRVNRQLKKYRKYLDKYANWE